MSPFWISTECKRLGSESYRHLMKTGGIYSQAKRTSGLIFCTSSFIKSFHKSGNCSCICCISAIFLLLYPCLCIDKIAFFSSTVICFLAHAMLANTTMTKKSRRQVITSAKNKIRMRVLYLRPIGWQVLSVCYSF